MAGAPADPRCTTSSRPGGRLIERFSESSGRPIAGWTVLAALHSIIQSFPPRRGTRKSTSRPCWWLLLVRILSYGFRLLNTGPASMSSSWLATM